MSQVRHREVTMQIRKTRPLLLTVTVIALLLSSKIVGAADWQYTGDSSVDKDEVAVFYDASGIQHLPNAVIRVWTTSVSLKSFDDYFNKHPTPEKQNVAKIAKRIANNGPTGFLLIPSIIKKYTSGNYKSLDPISLATEEVLINEGDVPISGKVYYEIDCAQKKSKALSVIIYGTDGEIKNMSSHESNYMFIPPDSTGDWLSQLVCSKIPSK